MGPAAGSTSGRQACRDGRSDRSAKAFVATAAARAFAETPAALAASWVARAFAGTAVASASAAMAAAWLPVARAFAAMAVASASAAMRASAATVPASAGGRAEVAAAGRCARYGRSCSRWLVSPGAPAGSPASAAARTCAHAESAGPARRLPRQQVPDMYWMLVRPSAAVLDAVQSRRGPVPGAAQLPAVHSAEAGWRREAEGRGHGAPVAASAATSAPGAAGPDDVAARRGAVPPAAGAVAPAAAWLAQAVVEPGVPVDSPVVPRH